MRVKWVWAVLVLTIVNLGITACDLGAKALLFSNLALDLGATGVVTLSAAGVPQLNSIQIGPNGAVTFDPSIIEVVSVAGANGFVVFASEIDNTLGEITLAAGSTSGPVPTGAVLEFTVKAVGPSGSSTPINITSIDFLLKVGGEPVGAYKVTPGKINVN